MTNKEQEEAKKHFPEIDALTTNETVRDVLTRISAYIGSVLDKRNRMKKWNNIRGIFALVQRIAVIALICLIWRDVASGWMDFKTFYDMDVFMRYLPFTATIIVLGVVRSVFSVRIMKMQDETTTLDVSDAIVDNQAAEKIIRGKAEPIALISCGDRDFAILNDGEDKIVDLKMTKIDMAESKDTEWHFAKRGERLSYFEFPKPKDFRYFHFALAVQTIAREPALGEKLESMVNEGKEMRKQNKDMDE